MCRGRTRLRCAALAGGRAGCGRTRIASDAVSDVLQTATALAGIAPRKAPVGQAGLACVVDDVANLPAALRIVVAGSGGLTALRRARADRAGVASAATSAASIRAARLASAIGNAALPRVADARAAPAASTAAVGSAVLSGAVRLALALPSTVAREPGTAVSARAAAPVAAAHLACAVRCAARTVGAHVHPAAGAAGAPATIRAAGLASAVWGAGTLPLRVACIEAGARAARTSAAVAPTLFAGAGRAALSAVDAALRSVARPARSPAAVIAADLAGAAAALRDGLRVLGEAHPRATVRLRLRRRESVALEAGHVAIGVAVAEPPTDGEVPVSGIVLDEELANAVPGRAPTAEERAAARTKPGARAERTVRVRADAKPAGASIRSRLRIARRANWVPDRGHIRAQSGPEIAIQSSATVRVRAAGWNAVVQAVVVLIVESPASHVPATAALARRRRRSARLTPLHAIAGVPENEAPRIREDRVALRIGGAGLRADTALRAHTADLSSVARDAYERPAVAVGRARQTERVSSGEPARTGRRG